MQALIDECDFVGMSFYAPVNSLANARRLRPRHRAIHGRIQAVRTDRADDQADAIFGSRHRRRPRHCEWNHRSGQSGADAMGRHGKSTQQSLAQPPMQTLRRQYHDALLEFLADAAGPLAGSAAFFWSMGSWDPHGHASAEFADPEIMAAIEKHNQKRTVAPWSRDQAVSPRFLPARQTAPISAFFDFF